MKRIGWLVLGIALAFAVPTVAQQEAAAPPEHAMVMPDVDQHLKMLSEKLTLTAEQQEKARPILKEMQDSMQKAMDDKSLTPEQMHAQMHSSFMGADKKLRTFLSDEQKAKLDEMEAQMHHGEQGQHE